MVWVNRGLNQCWTKGWGRGFNGGYDGLNQRLWLRLEQEVKVKVQRSGSTEVWIKVEANIGERSTMVVEVV